MVAALRVNERPDLRRSKTRELRNHGLLPAVVYGKNMEPITIAVDSGELLKTIRENGRHAVYTLDINGKSLNVMLYDTQEDKLKNQLIHVDFYQVDMSQEVEVEVAIRLDGQEKIKHGVVQQNLHQLQVRAKPADIPEFIILDISDLKIGDSLSIGDLIKDDNHPFEIVGDELTGIVTILPPQSAGEPEDTAIEATIDKQKAEEVAAEENEKEK